MSEQETSPIRKKRVLFHSNFCGSKTGFGGFMREILTYLYKTGKYELCLLGSGVPNSHPELERWPWKIYGTLPSTQHEINEMNRDPGVGRLVNYGSGMIDKVIQEFRPDVYFGSEDSWAFDTVRHKPWWTKIPCVVHTTIDSRPLLSQAVELAKSTPHFYCWAEFATKEFKKDSSLFHVETLRGSVNTNIFRRLPEQKRKELRNQFRIPEDAFCVGMLSRNQLRKSFPNLIDGYKLFKQNNPQIKNTRLLFFTHFGEGWNISKLCDEAGVDKSEVLCTYKCRATGKYFVHPFIGQDIDNPTNGAKKSLVTVNIQDGLTEEQVNEWYNLLDVYAHPFTSGGQERSIQEAKLAELITLVTDYSCGEDACQEGAGSLPLEFSTYREHGTEFIKATTYPSSISKQMTKVFNMDAKKKIEIGRQGRQWVLDNFSIEVIGKKVEAILDGFPISSYDFNFEEELKDPDAKIPEISDNTEWLKFMYKNILKMDVLDDNDGVKYWLGELAKNAPRPDIERFFRQTAQKENAGKNKVSIVDSFPHNPSERIMITMPESLGDCIYLTCLLEDMRVLYPDKKIFVATKPQFKEVFTPLIGVSIDYVVDWKPEFDNPYLLEGFGGHPKVFEMLFCPHFTTQRQINYLHNGNDKSFINLKKESV